MSSSSSSDDDDDDDEDDNDDDDISVKAQVKILKKTIFQRKKLLNEKWDAIRAGMGDACIVLA